MISSGCGAGVAQGTAGELAVPLPSGYVAAALGWGGWDPDEQVQARDPPDLRLLSGWLGTVNAVLSSLVTTHPASPCGCSEGPGERGS